MRKHSFLSKLLITLGLVLVLAFTATAKPARKSSSKPAPAPAPVMSEPEARPVSIARETFPLEREEVKLHLECLSSPEGGEPLLMIHGLTYSSHEFDVNVKDYSLARFFATHGYKVWLLDIAGYGQSGAVEDGFMPDSDYAAEDRAEAARFILNKSGRKSLDLLGWSWGTVTGSRFAASNTELVRKLVLYAPIVAGLGEAEIEEPFHKNTRAHAAEDFQVRKDKSIDYDIVEREVANTYLDNCKRYDKDTSPNAGRVDLCVSSADRLIPTSDLDIPVLIIAGSKDPYVSPELCKEAFESLPDKHSRLEIIDGAAHAMMMERPYYRIFREKVLDFLKAN